ncbi:MAG: hypothetical protein ACI9YH_004249 [Colwellia sp.]|jgi:hypothetical protein
MTEVTQEKKDFKQASTRKINEKNFYYTIQFLYEQTLPAKNYFDENMTQKIRDFYHGSPKITSSKHFVESKIEGCKKRILSNQEMINFNNCTIIHDEKFCKQAIEQSKKSIISYRDSYIELDKKIMFDLHSIVITLDDSTYKRMSNWIKQQRFRNKVELHQVTLSNAAFEALKELKSTLNSDNYNDAIIKINMYAKSKSWK